jgi:hypothetical protein
VKKDHNALFCRIIGVALWAAVLIPGAANAGPPFRTDDPEPVEYQHYEFYTFSTGTHISHYGPEAGLQVTQSFQLILCTTLEPARLCINPADEHHQATDSDHCLANEEHEVPPSLKRSIGIWFA